MEVTFKSRQRKKKKLFSQENRVKHAIPARLVTIFAHTKESAKNTLTEVRNSTSFYTIIS